VNLAASHHARRRSNFSPQTGDTLPVSSFRDAPSVGKLPTWGAGPESILTIVVMDSGFVLRAPQNDEHVRNCALDSRDLSKRIKLILPDGQISKILSSPVCKNISLRA
jgi:hypothetical protein